MQPGLPLFLVRCRLKTSQMRAVDPRNGTKAGLYPPQTGGQPASRAVQAPDPRAKWSGGHRLRSE